MSRWLILACVALLSCPASAMAEPSSRQRSVRITSETPRTSSTPTIVPDTAFVERSQTRDIDSSINNPSGVSIEFSPKSIFAMGESMVLRVTTRKAGYLILFDLDATGKLTQIFPNAISMSDPAGIKENVNLIVPGKPLTIPNVGSLSSYQLVASEPIGSGLVVAILSDKPLQFIDLPEVPPSVTGLDQALQFIRDTTRLLKIIPDTDAGRVETPKWSFASVAYTVK